MTSPEDLGQALAEIRHAAGMSQQELADWAGAHRQYIGQLESGQVSVQVRRLLDLFAVLGYDLALVPRSG